MKKNLAKSFALLFGFGFATVFFSCADQEAKGCTKKKAGESLSGII